MKIAFCFPGQGSQDVGMGRAMAEAVPGGPGGLRRGVRGRRLRRREALLRGFARGADAHRVAAAGARRHLDRLPARGEDARDQARLRDRPLGRRVLGARRRAARSAPARLSRSCGSGARRWPRPRARRPGAMAAVLGLDDAVVEELCLAIEGVWPANYNCPGQVVVSGENAAVDRLLEEAAARGARKTREAAGERRLPQPARRPRGRAAQADAHEGLLAEPVAAVHVHGDRASRGRAAHGRTCSSSSSRRPVKLTQAVRGLVKDGVGMFVEIGPGQVLSGLLRRCDRSLRTVSVDDPESLRKLQEQLSAA